MCGCLFQGFCCTLQQIGEDPSGVQVFSQKHMFGCISRTHANASPFMCSLLSASHGIVDLPVSRHSYIETH